MKARYALAILSALSLVPINSIGNAKAKTTTVAQEDYPKKAISTFKEYLGAMILKDYSRAASLFSKRFFAGGRSEMVEFKTEKVMEMLEKTFGRKDYSQISLEKIIMKMESGDDKIFGIRPLKEYEQELRNDWEYKEEILSSDYIVYSNLESTKLKGYLPMHKAFLLRCIKEKPKCKITGIF